MEKAKIAINTLHTALNDIIMNDFEEPVMKPEKRLEYAKQILQAIKIAEEIGDDIPNWCAQGIGVMTIRFWEDPDVRGRNIFAGILEMLKACL